MGRFWSGAVLQPMRLLPNFDLAICLSLKNIIWSTWWFYNLFFKAVVKDTAGYTWKISCAGWTVAAHFGKQGLTGDSVASISLIGLLIRFIYVLGKRYAKEYKYVIYLNLVYKLTVQISRHVRLVCDCLLPKGIHGQGFLVNTHKWSLLHTSQNYCNFSMLPLGGVTVHLMHPPKYCYLWTLLSFPQPKSLANKMLWIMYFLDTDWWKLRCSVISICLAEGNKSQLWKNRK